MKNKKILLALSPCLLVISVLVSCGNQGFYEKIVNVYKLKSTEVFNQKLYFSSSYLDIPFINIDDGLSLVESIYKEQDDKNYKLTGEANGEKYTIKRENGASIVFDFDNKVVTCDNYNKYRTQSYADNSFDIRSISGYFYDEQGKVIDENLIKITQVASKGSNPERKGNATSINLSDYNIPLVKAGKKYFVPFTTFYNIAGHNSIATLYNGENLFITGSMLDESVKNDEGKSLKDLYYSFTPKERSKAFKEYACNEFIRDLDYEYGLKDTHHISSFASLFDENGLRDKFLSNDGKEYRKALYSLAQFYLADFHSSFNFYSPYFDKLSSEEETELMLSIPQSSFYKDACAQKIKRMIYRQSHNISSGDISKGENVVVNPYMVNGETALITFDAFRINPNLEFYYTDEFKNNKKDYIQNDTLALISYANDEIKKNDAIKKVVIDLSCNSGGEADAAIFVLGWLNSAIIQIENPIDGYQGSIRYKSDINFDKKYVTSGSDLDLLNEESLFTTPKYKVYCLTSNDSFSCGNYVPAMLKQTGAATIVGTKSGGGACSVHVSGTADGSGFNMSSSFRLCSEKNGSFYNIDQGVEPDICLSDYATLYNGTIKEEKDTGDRANLFSYFNSL